MNKEPKVSVIIPVYNRSELVKKAIDSVLSQIYKNIEIVVVNDGSTDDTLDVILDYERNYPHRMVIINQDNQGQVVARNRGISESSGKVIAFLDSDDEWLPEKIAKQVPLLTGNVHLVYSGINEVDGDGVILKTVLCDLKIKGDISKYLLVKNRMTGGSVIVTRKALEAVGLFDPKLKAAENWDLWLRISKLYWVDFVNEPMVNYRRHDGNMSGDSELMLNAVKIMLDKHVKNNRKAIGDEIYNQAYANYYYLNGIVCMADYSCAGARAYYLQANSFCPGYLDVRQRVYRTYLGKTVNRGLAVLKKWILM